VEVEYLKKIVDGKRDELRELEEEYSTLVRQFNARRTFLQSQIEVFEDDLKRFDR
jgi:hypothetical protein